MPQPQSRRLLLFDLDGTLVDVHGAGRVAMDRAANELFGPHFTFDPVDMAGRLDPWIFARAAEHHGLPAAQHHDRFKATYVQYLRDLFDQQDPPHPRHALPGAAEVLDRLAARGDDTLGVLTGNYAESGTLKLKSVGLCVDVFTARLWGDTAPTRPGLVQAALADHPQATPDRVLVIGDTVHDVGCAKAHGCVSIAVTTGQTPAADLHAAGADHVIDDLRAFDW